MKKKKPIEGGSEFKGVSIDIDSDIKGMTNDRYINDLKNVIPTNTTAPTHTPKKFYDCFYWDSTASKLYIYVGGAWKDVTIT